MILDLFFCCDKIDQEEYYWEIPVEELYDPTEEPGDLTLGQTQRGLERVAKVKRKRLDP